MADPFTLLATGSVLTAISTVYTMTIGSIIFWGMIWIVGLGIIYMKSQNVGLTSIVASLTMASVVAYVPTYLQYLVMTLILIGFTVGIYSFYAGKK